jgi:hypothetical protein
VPLSGHALLQMQVAALFTHDATGRICFVNEPGGDRAPRFFFGRSREGNLWRCRDDLDEQVVQTLAELAAKEPVGADLRAEPRHLNSFLRALQTQGLCVSEEEGGSKSTPDRGC